MNSEIEQWIDAALIRLTLKDRKIEAETAKRIRTKVELSFVVGSPRVWWLGFRYLKSNLPSESTKLSSLVRDPNSIGHFIPEVESIVPPTYQLSANEVEDLVRECPFFEYYFLCNAGSCLIAETDHNQFLVAGMELHANL